MDILALDLPSVHYEKRELILDAINQVREIVIIMSKTCGQPLVHFLETNFVIIYWTNSLLIKMVTSSILSVIKRLQIERLVLERFSIVS